LTLSDRTLPGAVIQDVRRPPDEEVDGGCYSVDPANEDLAHVLPSVTLLQIFDLMGGGEIGGGGVSIFVRFGFNY